MSCYWHLCRRVDGLAGHAKDVSLPHVACAALYRAAKSGSVDCTKAVRHQPCKQVTVVVGQYNQYCTRPLNSSPPSAPLMLMNLGHQATHYTGYTTFSYTGVTYWVSFE